MGLALQMHLSSGLTASTLCGVQLGGHRNAVTDGFLAAFGKCSQHIANK